MANMHNFLKNNANLCKMNMQRKKKGRRRHEKELQKSTVTCTGIQHGSVPGSLRRLRQQRDKKLAADTTAAAAEAAPETTAAPAEAEGLEVNTTDPITITFSWWGGDARHDATQKAVAAFMEKYPNITVETQYAAWSGWEDKMIASFATATAPDVNQINWNWITSFSSDGSAFYDLNKVSDILDLSQFPGKLLS